MTPYSRPIRIDALLIISSFMMSYVCPLARSLALSIFLPLALTLICLADYVAYLLVQSLAILSCSSRFCVY